jgi:hypothetical protein
MDSQSSHGNLANHCRYGHTSAHTEGMRLAGNLCRVEDDAVPANARRC